MAISIASSSALALSSTTGRRTPPINHSSSAAPSFASSSSLFFNDSKRAGFGLAFKARTSIELYNNNEKRRGMSCNCLFGLGVPELAVIAGVAALVFGPKQLPEVGRSFGKTIKSFQQAAKEFESELKKEPEAAAESSGEIAVTVTDEEKQKSFVATEAKQDVTV